MTGVPEAAPSHEPIRRLRKEYALAGLSEAELAPDPFAQFAEWFDEALRAELLTLEGQVAQLQRCRSHAAE